MKFESETLDINNYQELLINYTDAENHFTLIIELKYFEILDNELGTETDSEKTIMTREYPKQWEKGQEAHYQVDGRNPSYKISIRNWQTMRRRNFW